MQGVHGGRREDDKMEEAQGSSSTVPKTEEFSRPDGFELDIVWFAIARLNSDEEAKPKMEDSTPLNKSPTKFAKIC